MGMIIEIRRIRNHTLILFDDGCSFRMQKSDLSLKSVEIGQTFDTEAFEKWILQQQYRKALDKAVSLLALRACSKGEINNKLSASGYSDCTVQLVLYKLQKESLLDDASFTDQWTEYRSMHRYGPRRIASELKRKGVSDELIEKAVDSISSDTQIEQAVHIAEKYAKQAHKGDDCRKIKQRAIAAIIRRGYSWGTAEEACSRVSFIPDDCSEEE